MIPGSDIEPFRFIKAGRRLFAGAIARLEEVATEKAGEDVAFEAILSLGKIGDPRSLGVLQTALENSSDRIEPISALGTFKNSTPVPKLLSLLQDQENPFKEEIARVLGEIGDPAAAKTLMELLRDQDRMVRYYAAWALYKIGGRDVVQSLCRLLSDPDEWIVINVLEILSRLREVEAIPALVGQFEIARDPRLKAIIISSLGTFAEPQLLSVFEEGLKSFDPRIQANAIDAISSLKISQLEMKRRLKRFFGHPNNRVRANVVVALQKSDGAMAIEEVNAMIQNPDIPTRRSAAFVLSRVSLPDRDKMIDRLLEDPAYVVRKMALKAALALETSVGTARISPLIKDSNIWVRKEAVDCARKIQEFPPATILAAFPEEKSPPVLESMLDFIVERHLDQAVGSILQKIRDEPEEGLPKLINTLGHLNAREAILDAKKILGIASPENLREIYIALLLHGEISVLSEITSQLKEKSREEELTTFIKVAGDVGAFLQETGKYSRKLVDALIPEIQADMAGIATFDGPAPPPSQDITPESIHKGVAMMNEGKLEEARTFLESYLRKFPGNREGLYVISQVQFKRGEPEKALSYLLELMEKVPGHVPGGVLLGQIHFQKKNWEALMKLYEGLKDKIPSDDRKTLGQVQGALGLAYFHLKRYAKAIEILNQALKTNSRDLSSCYHLALSYYAIKEHQHALKLLRGLKKSLPSDSRVLKNVEEILQKLEDES